MDSKTDSGDGSSSASSSSNTTAKHTPVVTMLTAPLPPTPLSPSTLAAVQPKRLQTLLNIPEHMDLSQIELIYRAEGNANLVLALPQFKKVLRLPKMKTPQQQKQPKAMQSKAQQDQVQEQHRQQQASGKQQQQSQEQQQHHEKQQQIVQQEDLQNTSALTVYQNAKVGSLTMNDFMAYIQLIRQLVGEEFIFDVNIAAITKESERIWINEHIKPHRPAQRLDKEFCGQFGLLLTDATQLPAKTICNILLSDLQPKIKLTGETYAVEIKPKQGWLLPSDVNILFDLQCTEKLTTATPEAAAEEDATATAGNMAASQTQRSMITTECRCRYCAMQYLKLKYGKINKRSAYCPLDLFSGIRTRMLDALDALFMCPQNNLRVFRGGILIYGEHADSLTLTELNDERKLSIPLALIKELLVKCLLRDYSKSNWPAEDEAGEPHVSVKPAATAAAVVVIGQPHSSATLTQSQTKEQVKLIEIEPAIIKDSKQRKLSKETLKANIKPIKTTREAGEGAPAIEALTTCNEPELLCLPKNCILQKVLQLQLLAKKNLHFMLANGYAETKEKSYGILEGLLKKQTMKDNKSQSLLAIEQLTPEQQYLLAATALDCSIMITFQEADFENEIIPVDTAFVHFPEYSRGFVTNITLLDLDPKPDSHFHKYLKQSKEIQECLNERKVS